MAEPSARRAHALMVLYAFMISTSFPVGKAITADLDPVVLTFLRFVVAAALFAVLVPRSGGWPRPRDAARYLAISAAIVGFFVAMFEALRWTDAVSAGALFTLVPLISAAIAWPLLGETTGARRLAWLAVGAAGAVWVLFGGSLARLLAFDFGRGEAIFVLGCVAFGAYSPLVRKLHRGEPVAELTLWVLVGGAVLLGIIGGPRIVATAWAEVPLGAYLGVLYLGAFNTAVTFAIAKYASVALDAPRVMAYTYLTPGFVVLLEGAMGGGWPSLSVSAGLALTVAATVLLERA